MGVTIGPPAQDPAGDGRGHHRVPVRPDCCQARRAIGLPGGLLRRRRRDPARLHLPVRRDRPVRPNVLHLRTKLPERRSARHCLHALHVPTRLLRPAVRGRLSPSASRRTRRRDCSGDHRSRLYLRRGGSAAHADVFYRGLSAQGDPSAAVAGVCSCVPRVPQVRLCGRWRPVPCDWGAPARCACRARAVQGGCRALEPGQRDGPAGVRPSWLSLNRLQSDYHVELAHKPTCFSPVASR